MTRFHDTSGFRSRTFRNGSGRQPHRLGTWFHAAEQPCRSGPIEEGTEVSTRDRVEFALRRTRWHCGCASSSSCRIARAHGYFCTSADREGEECLYRDRRRHPDSHSRHAHDREKRKDPLVVESFLYAIDTTRRRGFAVNPLQNLGLADFDESNDCSIEEDDDICANRSRPARRSWT